MNFGEKLKDLRTQKGWSQEELAKQMGVTRRTIGGYEAGTTYPRTRDMYQYCCLCSTVIPKDESSSAPLFLVFESLSQ